jgi:hypothetical protein
MAMRSHNRAADLGRCTLNGEVWVRNDVAASLMADRLSIPQSARRNNSHDAALTSEASLSKPDRAVRVQMREQGVIAAVVARRRSR